jgi:hypothetical protein
MPFDKFIDIDNINEARRKAVAKSIRTISVEELKNLGDQIFDFAGSSVAGKILSINRRKSCGCVLSRRRGRRHHFSLRPGPGQRIVVSAQKRHGTIVGKVDKGAKIMKEAIKQSP